MSTVSDTRRQHLEQLVQSHGGVPGFATATGSSEDHVRQMLKGAEVAGGRNMGARVARRIEASLKMREGALDRPIAPEAPQAPWDEDFMRWVITEYEAAIQGAKLNHPPAHKAKIILRLYGYWAGTGERPSRAVLLRLIQRERAA
jgi:hypothetical protein